MLIDPTVAYLNSGAAGPLPRTVHERVTQLRRRLAEEPLDFLMRDAPTLLWAARDRLAEFIGADPRRVVLTINVTAAVNLLASGLALDSPGEILLTEHEYTPMRWCWERAARRQHLDIRTLQLPAQPSEPAEIIEAAMSSLGPRTKLFFFSHVVAATGLILPVKQLCAAARAIGVPTVIDGAHGPAFTDLHMGDLDCDFYVGAGHKWLLAPTGTGFLHVGRSVTDRVQPTQVSWGYCDADDDGGPDQRDAFGRTSELRRLEIEGTRDICPWLTLPEAIDFQAALGHAAIRTRMRELSAHVRERLHGWHGLVALTPENPELHCGITAFDLPRGTNSAWLRQQLWERYRLEVAVMPAGERTLLRVSTHFFNTEIEANHLQEAVAQLLSEGSRWT
jgi:isopenicillin-N epimerase